MRIDVQSLEECVQVIRSVRDFMRCLGVLNGHDIDSCACRVCLGYRLAKETAEEVFLEVETRDAELRRR